MSTKQSTDSRTHGMAEALVRLEKAAKAAAGALKAERARADDAAARLAELEQSHADLKKSHGELEKAHAALEKSQAGLDGLLSEVEDRIDDAVASIQGVLDGATEAEAVPEPESAPEAEAEPAEAEEILMADDDSEPAADEADDQPLSLLS